MLQDSWRCQNGDGGVGGVGCKKVGRCWVSLIEAEAAIEREFFGAGGSEMSLAKS